MPTFARTQEVEHEIGLEGTFGLRLTAADVELRATDEAVARARVTFELRASSESEADEIFEPVKLRVVAGAGTLRLEEADHADGGFASIARLIKTTLGGEAVSYRVDAEVPRRAQLAIEGVSSEVTAAGFRGSQQFRTVSGDLVLTGVGGGMRLNSVSGDASLRAEEPLGLKAASVSGDISVIAPRFTALAATTVSGDVDVEGELAAGTTHEVETVSGDLSLAVAGGFTLEVRGISSEVDVALPHRTEGPNDRRRYVVGDGSARVVFSSMSGDARVGPPRRGAVRPPAPSPAPSPPAAPLPTETEELEILRAVERGEIDVEEATRRLGGGGGRA
jgi:hypothetical protein